MYAPFTDALYAFKSRGIGEEVGLKHIRRDDTGKFAPLAKIKIKKLTGVYPALTPNLIVPLKLYQTGADLRVASINLYL